MQYAALCFSLSILIAYAVALALYPFLRARNRWTVVAVSIAVVALFSCMLLIPRERIGPRAVAAFLSVDLVFRVVDLARQMRHEHSNSLTFPIYCRFLIPFPILLVVFNLRSRHLPSDTPRGPELWRVVIGGTVFTVALLVTLGVRTNAALQSSFLLDHVIKVVLFVVGIESASHVALGIERLAKFDPIRFVDRMFLARTPAEFWFRYNQRIRLWLTFNAFLPFGGRRAPARGILAAFVVSAVLHELAFGLATSRFDGYQALFFLLQAPAVILSRRLERLASSGGFATKAIAHGLTILWMGSTSIFFFHGLNRVLPFIYASQPWLP
jgi:hypothetical protein